MHTGLEFIFTECNAVHADAGTRVLRQGDACNHYLYITAGQVKVFTRASSGRELLLYTLCPGDLCVLTASCMIGSKPFPAEATVERAVDAKVITKVQFNRWLQESDAFRSHVLTGFGERMADLVTKVHEVALEPVEQRLIRYLLAQNQTTLHQTHQIIAQEIGSAREVVSRQLKRLEVQGLISLERGLVRILNSTALKQLI